MKLTAAAAGLRARLAVEPDLITPADSLRRERIPEGTRMRGRRSQKSEATYEKGSDMNVKLPSAVVALALVAGTAAHHGGAVRSGFVTEVQAQSTAPSTEAVPCGPPAKPLASPGQGQTGCQSDGVIRPPVTGDQGVVRPPETSQSMPMPVIPPPGTPGGNPGAQPK